MKHASSISLVLIFLLTGIWLSASSSTIAQEPASRMKWQHAVYSEQITNETKYSWDVRGRSVTATSHASLLRELGYNVSDKAEPVLPLVTVLDFFVGQGWELAQTVHEPQTRTTRYIFRRSVD